MKQRKKSFGMRISAFVLSFAMVCTLLAGVNVVAFAAETDDELTDTVSVLRAYNPNNGEHLMTIDEAEYNANVARGYSGEGEAWKAPIYSETEVWRAYNPNSGEHMLAPQAEVVALSQAGWQNEGLKMYSDDNMGVPIYRVFNPNATDAGSHHYCGEEEAAALVELGWQWDNNGEPVIYGCEEKPPVILVGLTDADQLTANTLEVTFDQDASLLVDKDDITVAKADGTLVLPILNMEMAADGMSAKLTLSTNFADGVDYVASLNTSEVGFTASLGEVAAVIVTTDKAQKGVVTPIEFTLYDSQGVDVTSTVDLDATVTVDVVGDAQSDTSDPAKSTLTMDEVGAEAEIIVTYNDGEGEMEDIIGRNTVTCIPAEAVVGYPIYAALKDSEKGMYENPNNNMAKFYLGKMMTEPVTVVVGDESDTIYFSAANLTDFSIYNYEEYEIESSDEDVMSIGDIQSQEGKKCAFKVNGNEAGTANVVITAKVNDTETPYTIPVRVVEKGKLASVTYTVDKTRMTNAADSAYFATSTAYAVDTNGMKMTGNGTDGTDGASFEYKVTAGKYGPNDDVDQEALKPNDIQYTAQDTWQPSEGFTLGNAFPVLVGNGNDGEDVNTYTAYKSAGGKKTIQVTASCGTDSKNKSISITVDKLGSGIWNDGDGNDQTVTYAVELSSKNVLSNPDKLMDDAAGVQAKLAASVGGKFVGYVRTDATGHMVIGSANQAGKAPTASADGNASTQSAIKVTKDSAIEQGSLAFGVKYGSKYASLGNFAALDPALAGAAVICGADRNTLFNDYLGTADNVVLGTMLNDGIVGANFAGIAGVAVVNPDKAGQYAGDITAIPPVMPADTTLSFIPDASIQEDTTPAGTYEVTFAWISAKDGKAVVTKNEKLTVGTLLETIASAETITVKSRTVDSLSDDGVKDVLVARADMNNVEGETSVITGFADKDGTRINNWGTEKSKYVKYAIVTERVDHIVNNGQEIASLYVDFYVPINTTFRTE